ncbi:MAG: hypothetical protein MUC56_00210 [Thermoanaerobaculales bacterium]|nr:hypothetical protein [Thermoanaerobaculales bacterium]
MTPRQLVETVRDGLAARGFDRRFAINLDDDRLNIEFRWMGTTRFEYRIVPRGAGFRAVLVGQRVAPLHAAFADRFEHYFGLALTEVGARAV